MMFYQHNAISTFFCADMHKNSNATLASCNHILHSCLVVFDHGCDVLHIVGLNLPPRDHFCMGN